MNPLDWAKEKARRTPKPHTYVTNPTTKHPQGESRRIRDIDSNELGKLFATLHRRGRQEVASVLQGLTSTNGGGQPQSGFGRRSNNKWLGLFKVLQIHVFKVLPPSGADGKDDIRAVRWLRRLLDIKEKDRALFDWLMEE